MPVSCRPSSISPFSVSLKASGCSRSCCPWLFAEFHARSIRNETSADTKSGSACSTMHPSDSNVLRCPSTTVRTRASKGTPPRLRNHATRTPLKLRSSGRAKCSPGSLIESGARESGPAIVLSANARSATERPRQPDVLSVDHAKDDFGFGTRPTEGRKPTTLQKAAGLRSEPPVSEPVATGTSLQASATAAPPDDPPHVLVRSYGLYVAPKTLLNVCDPAPNSGVLVLPMMIAPARRIRSTTMASSVGT